MFPIEFDIEEVLIRLVDDSIDTIRKMSEAGFPVRVVPPHYACIYLIRNEDSREAEGVVKTDVKGLSSFDPETWTTHMLSQLEHEIDDKEAFGIFHGFIGAKETNPDMPIFIGMIISPTGEEVKGVYVCMEDDGFDGEYTISDLWADPFILAPYLDKRFCIPLRTVVH